MTTKAILVRVGIDQSYGNWNAPVNSETGEFVFVPIPERKKQNHKYERVFDEIKPCLLTFAEKYGKNLHDDLGCPFELWDQEMHLDPDFNFLTYGDKNDTGSRRGAKMSDMGEGDLVAFYSGMRPVDPCVHKLVYALIGLYVVEERVLASDVPESRWYENAHTRRQQITDTDVVVRAKPDVSGRLKHCIPIGEWRDRAYRVSRDLLDAWGGLSVKDGFIQRSAVPPSFIDPVKFYNWFKEQNPTLVQDNNPL